MRDERSYELFDLPEAELNLEQELKLDRYIYDIANPVWKDVLIDGKASGYLISNIGEIKGKRGNILEKELTNVGYFRINGYHNKKSIHLSIHRELAKAFIPNPENELFVNHINGKKTCNWVGNLEWVTHQENMQHAVDMKLIDAKGEKHPENVYSEKQIRQACEMLENGARMIDITRKTGINRSILYSIRMGNSWSQISCDYDIPKPISMNQEFSEKELIEASKLLANTKLSYDKIHKITGIPPRTQMKILSKSPKYKRFAIEYGVYRKRKMQNTDII